MLDIQKAGYRRPRLGQLRLGQLRLGRSLGLGQRQQGRHSQQLQGPPRLGLGRARLRQQGQG